MEKFLSIPKIKVSLAEKEIADLSPVKQVVMNAGTEDDPFMNTALVAQTPGGYVKVRFPESGGSSEDIVFATVIVPSAGVLVGEEEMSCQF